MSAQQSDIQNISSTALSKMMYKKLSMDPSYKVPSTNTVVFYEQKSIRQSKLALGYHDKNIKNLMTTYFNSSFFSKVTPNKSKES